MKSSLWKDRDFKIVLLGGLINDAGDWALNVALPAFVFVETGSGRATALIVVAELCVAVFLGPYGGSLADKWDLRRTLIFTNLLQAVALLPLLTVNHDRIWPVFLVAIAQGLLKQLNDPASYALLPRVVQSDQLVEANAARSAGSSIARLIGSPLGGIAVAFGGLHTVVLIDGFTFLSIAATMLFLSSKYTENASEQSDEADVSAGIREGWQEIKRHESLVGYLGVQAVASAAFAMFPVLFIVFVVDVLHGNEADIGVIRGVSAFGGILAAIVVGRQFKNSPPAELMRWGYLALGVIALVFVNMPNLTTRLWVFLVLFALTGLPNVISQTGATATGQAICPKSVLGRFHGLSSSTGAATAIAASIATGLLIDTVDVITLLNIQAGLFLVCGIATHLFVVRVITAEQSSSSSQS